MSIRCAQCGKEVSDTAYACPKCGFDVRELKAHGNGCWNCEYHSDCSDYNDWKGPSGYPCLRWSEDGNDYD